MKTNLICLSCVRLKQQVSKAHNDQLSRISGTPAYLMGQLAISRAQAALREHEQNAPH